MNAKCVEMFEAIVVALEWDTIAQKNSRDLASEIFQIVDKWSKTTDQTMPYDTVIQGVANALGLFYQQNKYLRLNKSKLAEEMQLFFRVHTRIA
jgi:hypothetical protein